MKNTEKTGFLPTVPFQGEHPDMQIAWVPAAEDKAGENVFAMNTETWD